MHILAQPQPGAEASCIIANEPHLPEWGCGFISLKYRLLVLFFKVVRSILVHSLPSFVLVAIVTTCYQYIKLNDSCWSSLEDFVIVFLKIT